MPCKLIHSIDAFHQHQEWYSLITGSTLCRMKYKKRNENILYIVYIILLLMTFINNKILCVWKRLINILYRNSKKEEHAYFLISNIDIFEDYIHSLHHPWKKKFYAISLCFWCYVQRFANLIVANRWRRCFSYFGKNSKKNSPHPQSYS